MSTISPTIKSPNRQVTIFNNGLSILARWLVYIVRFDMQAFSTDACQYQVDTNA